MKEKKNTKLRKTLLMMTSVVLVAAISVGATLAYLTAQTDPIKNEFRSASNIQGKVIEPTFTTTNSMHYKPGKEVPKDPRIDNDTSGKQIYAGLKLDFYIKSKEDADSAARFKKVTFAQFSKFVDINTLPSTTTDKASGLTADSTGTGAWHYVNTSSDGETLYYMYDKKLDPNDMDVAGTTSENGGGDTSEPIFTGVTVKSGLHLSDEGTDLLDSDIEATNPLTKNYNGFEYRIRITGYGVTVDEAGDIATARTKLLGADMMNITAA